MKERYGRLLPWVAGLIAVVALVWLLRAFPGATPLPPERAPDITTREALDTQNAYAAKRETMVERDIQGRGLEDPVVLEVMSRVPRHEFVDDRHLDQAYADHPLPIGYGQTIPQPYIVALMTSLLEIEHGDKVLEIGAGSGYQAAVLAEITPHVYTVEIIPELAQQASERLERLGYDTVQVRHADGYHGWAEYAPYDAIIVTAAADHIPQPLIQQLKDGGRMVIPVGPAGGYQTLWRITREGDEIRSENKGGVIFVPFTRDQ